MLINDPNHLYKPNLNLPHISSIKGLYFKVYKYYICLLKQFKPFKLTLYVGFTLKD